MAHSSSETKWRRPLVERRRSDLFRFRGFADRDVVVARLRIALQRAPNRVGAEPLDNAIKLGIGVPTAAVQLRQGQGAARKPRTLLRRERADRRGVAERDVSQRGGLLIR